MATTLPHPPQPNERKGLFAAGLGLLALAAIVGTMCDSNPGSWYRDLAKPDWTPAPTVFSIVWPVLYVMQALAAWRVWMQRENYITAPVLRLFGVQLLANLAWTPLFFGLQSTTAGLLWIVVVLVLASATALQFLRIDRLAGLLMVPYVAWVAFAAALMGMIWHLNPGA